MFLLTTSLAFASAYYNLDSGTRALGRGGAFVVGADDFTAMYYNPAALGHIEHTTVGINSWAINQYVKFDRADEPGEDGEMGTEDDLVFDAVYNDAGWFPIPNLGAVFKLGGLTPKLENTTLAVGVYTPTAPSMDFRADGGQRYSLINSLVWQIFYGASVAQKLGPVTLGVGLNANLLRVEESLAVTTAAGGTDDPANDVRLDISAWDTNQISWTAGVIVAPIDQLEIGASVQPAINYSGKGEMTATFNEEHGLLPLFTDDTYTDEEILLFVTTPWVFKGGVQVLPSEKLRIEADFTYTTWSQVDELVVRPCSAVTDRHETPTAETCTDGGMIIEVPEDGFLESDVPIIADVGIPTGFENAYSIRVGGDYDINKWLEVRAGVNYESSAVPSRLQGVSVVDGNKIGYGAGATFRFAKRWAIDAAFSQQFIFSRTITDSEFRQVTLELDAAQPENTVVAAGKVVGNGDFASRLTYAGIGATVFFGGNAASATP